MHKSNVLDFIQYVLKVLNYSELILYVVLNQQKKVMFVRKLCPDVAVFTFLTKLSILTKEKVMTTYP